MIKLQQYFNSISQISEPTWAVVSKLFRLKTLKKHDYFIREGEMAREIAFLESGLVRAFYRNNEGVEYNKHFFISPCFIGAYASLITGQKNQINQEALTECRIWVANYTDLQSLYDAHPDLERVSRKMAESFFVQKEEREIALVLLDADKRYEILQRDFPALEQLVPQYHIASYLGITPTQLSRIRKKASRK